MADTAKRLAGPSSGTGAEATLYTAPTAAAGAVAILRNIRVANNSTAAQTFSMSIGADAAGVRLYPTGFAVPGSGIHDWSGFQVLSSGETLRWIGNGNLTISVHGVEST
jgi:hypothetical protein